MIGKVTRGSDVGGLLRYLYGPGKANEHTNPHLVASWRADDRTTLDQLEPSPGRGRQHVAHLADRLTLPLQLLPDVPDKHVWQCSMRLADGDRRLTDPEWAQVAREVVEATGFAPAGDAGSCRWVAVRHAEDHIHIAVVLARQDGQPVHVFRDWPKVHAAARAVERRFGLTTVPSPDRSAAVAPTRGEVEKARRTGAREPVRVSLARQVRIAAAGSTSRDEFEALLGRREDVVLVWRASQREPGQMTGYKVGRAGHVDAQGEQVWFSGSKLSPDLSLPKLQARWAEVPSVAAGARSRRDLLMHASGALDRATRGPLPWGAAIAAGETASSLGFLVEGDAGGALTDAADDLMAAVRRPGGQRPVMDLHVHDLRSVASNLSTLGRIAPGEAGNAMIIAANLARIAHSLTEAPGTARHRAALRAARRFAGHAGPPHAYQVAQVRRLLPPEIADVVLKDPAWPALASQMRRLEGSGRNASIALSTALASREIHTATSVAQVLHYRLLQTAHATAPPRGQSQRRLPRLDKRR